MKQNLQLSMWKHEGLSFVTTEPIPAQWNPQLDSLFNHSNHGMQNVTMEIKVYSLAQLNFVTDTVLHTM
jgi:hypothetical protein